VEEIYIHKEILHAESRERHVSRAYPEGGYEYVGDAIDFMVLLDERHLDETLTLEAFKQTIIRELKDEISRD